MSLLYGSIRPLERASETLNEPPEENAELIDKLEYLLQSDEETIVLCKSDIERPTIDGRIVTAQQWLETWATYLDAKRYKMIRVTQEDVDKMLLRVQRDYHLSEEDLRRMFKSNGYSWEDAQRMLEVMQIEKARLDIEFSSKGKDMITDQEIQEYCRQHPVYEQGKYTLQRALVPFDSTMTRDEQHRAITTKITNDLTLVWSSVYTLEEDELPDDARYFTSLAPGQISEPRETDKGFEMIKLVAKVDGREVPADERADECKELLREQALDRLFNEFHENMIAQTSIIKF